MAKYTKRKPLNKEKIRNEWDNVKVVDGKLEGMLTDRLIKEVYIPINPPSWLSRNNGGKK
jgi:hypothetical protein